MYDCHFHFDSLSICSWLYINIDNRLNWKTDSLAVHKKEVSRLYFLRKPRSFDVVQQDVGDVLSACCGQRAAPHCGLLGLAATPSD